uniref:Peptidase family M3 n=1 Tax=Mimivirus LCMiAC01 TaxID=2506608 RepID=A0A481Z0Z8_9VIRU|nr:MAG: peptidase family M3 [Mimivirus LCMiAC01]
MNNINECNMWQKWNISAEEIINRVNIFIKKSINNNNLLANFDLSDINKYKNFLSILSDDITESTNLHAMCEFLQYIGKTKKIKDYSYLAEKMITKHNSNLNTKKDLYNKLIKVYNIAAAVAKHHKYYDDVRFIDKIIKKYIRSGINLNDNDSKQILIIRREIDKIEDHILEYINIENSKLYGYTKKELYGLPSKYINNLPIIKRNPIKYGICMDDDTYNKCMKYITDSSIRKNIDLHYGTKCNKCIGDILRLFVLRHKCAQLLSYKNHSEYVVKNQMANTPENVNNFLKDLLKRLDYRYFRELQSLHSVMKKHGNSSQQINKWDLEYYITKWKMEYGVNDKIIREYFVFDNVLHAVLQLYQELFNLKFIRIHNADAWNPTVLVYAIVDLSKSTSRTGQIPTKASPGVGLQSVPNESLEHSGTNKIIGYFYLDLLKRPNKHMQTTNTRCFCLKSSCIYPLKQNTHQLPIAVLISSFQSMKTMLDYTDVLSLIYEFGHVIQHICGYSKYCIFSGINVEDDFMKVIPQILGHLCRNKDILKRLSSHYRTKKPLPDVIIDKMTKSKNLNIGLCYKNHILIAIYDQLVHSSDNFISVGEKLLKSKNYTHILNFMTDIYKKIYQKVMQYNSINKYSIIFNDGVFMPISWSRLIHGSESQYYGCIWSKIISSDIYYNKFVHGSSTGYKNAAMELKVKVLNKSGSCNAYTLMTNYLGKPPSINGFVKLYSLDTDTEFSFFMNTDMLSSNINSTNISYQSKVRNKIFPINKIETNPSILCPNNFDEIYETDMDTPSVNEHMYLKNKLNNDNNMSDDDTEDDPQKYKEIFFKKPIHLR